VTWITVAFANGGSDSMAPIDGVVALAAPLSAAPLPSDGQPEGTVNAFGSNGSQVSSVIVGPGTAVGSPPSICLPAPPLPPTLPKPGPQPAHVARARAAVTKAFEVLYGRGPARIKFAYLQDADQQVAKAGKAAAATIPKVATKSFPVVKQVVFTSKTHAAVLYEIEYQRSTVVGPKVGYAVLVGKTWKVTRATFCGDIDNAHTGINC